MANNTEKKYVSELLDIKKDIEPYNTTAIWSGVGSGKNGFIEGVHEKFTSEDGSITITDVIGLAEKHRVLIITSRKAKVTETSNRHKTYFDSYLTDIRYIDDVNFDEYDSKSLVCTTAHIKQAIQYYYTPETIITLPPFWKKFDYIVIDEFHSLVDDATFSDSAFIMKCFIEKIYEDNLMWTEQKIKPKLILMSGTPYYAKELIQHWKYKEYDLINIAKNVKPERIKFNYYKNALHSLKQALKLNKQVVYYMCHMNKLYELIDAAKEAGIEETQIAVSVSDSETNKELEEKYPETLAKNTSVLESSLSKNEEIPNDIKLLITNGKNKEGINIKTIPELLIIENHAQGDIIQICGRFRKGVKHVHIVLDAQQFRISPPYIREEEYCRDFELQAANDFFTKLVNEYNCNLQYRTVYRYEELIKFIEFIEKKTMYIRFNPFKNKFEMNICFIVAKKRIKQEDYDFKKTIEGIRTGQIHFNKDSIYYNAICFDAYTLNECFKMYMEKKNWIIGETVFDKKAEEVLLKELTQLYNEHPETKNREYSKLGQLLRKFGYKKKTYGKCENQKFTIITIDTDTKTKVEQKKTKAIIENNSFVPKESA